MHILVVDDEPVVAQTLGLILRQAGHEVECFLRPEEVLSALSQHSADLLLTDMSMPIMNGVELALQVVDRFPACHVIILSGSRPMQRSGALDFNWAPYEMLYKPLDPRDLLRVVARVGRAAA